MGLVMVSIAAIVAAVVAVLTAVGAFLAPAVGSAMLIVAANILAFIFLLPGKLILRLLRKTDEQK